MKEKDKKRTFFASIAVFALKDLSDAFPDEEAKHFTIAKGRLLRPNPREEVPGS